MPEAGEREKPVEHVARAPEQLTLMPLTTNEVRYDLLTGGKR